MCASAAHSIAAQRRANMMFNVVSPVDNSIYAQREYSEMASVNDAMMLARSAFVKWRRIPLAERCRIIRASVAKLMAKKDILAKELSNQVRR